MVRFASLSLVLLAPQCDCSILGSCRTYEANRPEVPKHPLSHKISTLILFRGEIWFAVSMIHNADAQRMCTSVRQLLDPVEVAKAVKGSDGEAHDFPLPELTFYFYLAVDKY